MKLREFPSSSSQTANNGQRKRTFAIIQWLKKTEKHRNGAVRKME